MRNLRSTLSRLFYTGIPGPILDSETRRLHRDFPFGGVVLFRHNLSTPRQVRALVDNIHRLDPELPPLVAIDHEGGRVHRFDAPFTHFPSAATVAAHGLPSVRAAATAMGRELAAVGIDLDFAPVLDVASNPRNPIIGDRAFGTTPERATRAALTAFRALRSQGLLTCGKHFPGHGDTTSDSHLELPVVERSRRALQATELFPFARAIAAGIPMLMTAHVHYPALDPELPATLSHRILTGLLRRRMAFRGVICSDDLEMRAIADHYDPGDAAVRALAAGADLLLFCHRQDQLRIAIAAVERALDDGRLPPARIAQARRRVVGLIRWRLRRPHRVPLSAIGCRAHARLNTSLGAE